MSAPERSEEHEDPTSLQGSSEDAERDGQAGSAPARSWNGLRDGRTGAPVLATACGAECWCWWCNRCVEVDSDAAE